MTISNPVNSVTVLGNGAQTVFAYNFPIPDKSVATLYLDNGLTTGALAATAWQLDTPGAPLGGTFTYPRPGSGGAALPAGSSLTLVRSVPGTQPTRLINQGAYYPDTVEAALDWIVMQSQQHAAGLQRAVRAPAYDPPLRALPSRAARANSAVVFDAGGDVVTLPILTNTIYAAAGAGGIDPSLPPYNANSLGTADATAAFAAAFAAARLKGGFVTPSPGKYRIDGTLDPYGISLIGPGIYSREASDPTAQGVVLLHNGSGPLFAPTAAGWTCRGITFFDPNQPGTGAAPVNRPPIIQVGAGNRMIDVTFCDNVVVNCFNFLLLTTGGIMGDVRMSGNRIYAVRHLFVLWASMPEFLFFSDNIVSPGVWQAGAILLNSGMLAKWTSKNGSLFNVNVPGGSIDGIKSANNGYFGYRRAIIVVDGQIAVSEWANDTFDCTGTILEIAGTGQFNASILDGCHAFCYTYLDTAFETNAFEISASTQSTFSVRDFRGDKCAGNWISITGTGTIYMDFDGALAGWGVATGISGDRFALVCNNNAANVKFSPANVLANYSASVGFILQKPGRLRIMGVQFGGCKNVGAIEAAATGALLMLNGCTSFGTSGAKSVINSAPSGTPKYTGCEWDKPADP